jgi:glycine C-acetyltransferase
MDGDMANLPAILEVTERHGVPVFIDEAHSIMGCGAHGRGVAEHYGVEGRIGLQYATFSKALAGVGSFVSGSKRTLDYLRFYANTYGFSCALPPATVAGILAGIEVVEKCPAIREQLWTNADYFRRGVQGLGISTGHSTTYVVPLVIGSDRKLLYDLGHEMRRRGLFLAPVDYPSVPQDEVRFRASVTAAHTRADLDEALNIIEDTIAKRLRS